jgi:exonuclease SbcC
MIGTVRISNWKRHQAFEHTFAPGLNFILGANGKGKTSLLEAIRFGLLGSEDLDDSLRAIRFDANSAIVQVELTGDDPVMIGRSIDSRGRITETVNKTDALNMRQLLVSRFGADPAFLRSLLFLGEGDIYATGAGSTGLEQQLESLLPIDGLSRLVGHIRSARKPLGKEQRSQRTALQLTRDELVQLAQEEVGRRTELEQLRVQESELQDHYLVAADRARMREEWTKYETAHNAWQRQVDAFAKEADIVIDVADLDRALVELDNHRQELDESLRGLTEQRGELAGRIAAVGSFLDDLNAPLGQRCPLCKQPLDEAHRTLAIEEHKSELNSLTARRDELEAFIAAARAELDRCREAAERARRFSANRPAAPTAVELASEEAIDQLERARTAVEELRLRRALVEQQLFDVRERLATAEASRRLEEQVTRAFRDDALLEAAEVGIQEFLVDTQRSVMAPLAHELSQQWKAYLPDAEWVLALDPAGALCLSHGADTRPYSALSGGEKTVATVLLRVALLTALTTSDVIVLDEPLEHLDPRARRLLISSLHQAIRKGLLRQILISTYEESLVRRLLTRSDVDAVWLD